MLTLDLQLYAVLVMFLTGVALGFVFDVYRGVRSALNPGPIATGIGDFVFWLVGTIILIVALLFGTWGEVRLFVPVGIALGLVTYRALTGRIIARATRRALRLLYAVVRTAVAWTVNAATLVLSGVVIIVKVVLWPVLTVLNVFSRPLNWLRRTASSLLAPLVRLRRRIGEALRTFRDGPPPEL